MKQTCAHALRKTLGARFGLLALALFLVLSAGCGRSDVEEGILPDGVFEGAVVALKHDAANGRLLKAYPHALAQSTDGGDTWQPIPVPAAAREGEIAAVSIAANSSGLIYIAGPRIGVMSTDDDGRSWTRRSEGLPDQGVRAFATHATLADTLYAFIPERGIFRSKDSGKRWKRVDGGPGVPIHQLFHSDMPGSMETGWLFAATPEGVWRSMDCFCGWRPAGTLPDAVKTVAYDPEEPKRVYAATGTELFRSSDGGESWDPVPTAVSNIRALAVDSSGTVYVAASDGTLLRSVDRGESWERVGA